MFRNTAIFDKRVVFNLLLAFALGSFVGWLAVQMTSAAPPTSRSDVMTSQAASNLSSHTISFTMTGSTSLASGETITIDFDEDGGEWAVDAASSVVADFDVYIESEQVVYSVTAGAADCSGSSGTDDIAIGIVEATGVVTLEACSGYTTTSAGATVTVEYGTAATNNGTGTDRVTNPTAAEYQLTIAGTYGDDSSDISIDIVSDDQVVISATVDEAMNFAISDNSIGFGTLSSASARYANGAGTGSGTETEAHTITVGTNASNGFSFTVNGATLTSGTDTITAIGASNSASNPGNEQFGLRATVSGGSGTVSSPYAAAGFALDTSAFPDEVGSSSAGSDDSVYSMRYLANIASATEAGAYSSTLTYVASGTF